MVVGSDEYDEFLRRACAGSELEWRKYRRRSARKRVLDRVRELGLEGLSEYLDRLRDDPAEAAALPDIMRVTVTRFFRERGRWDVLVEGILPELLAKDPRPTFRAWSAGCCGGEEPYTLALLWQERLKPRFPEVELEILATDIDGASLDRAARAVYERGSLREVPPGVVERWFLPVKGGFRLRPEAARLVTFRVHNLRTDPPPAAGVLDLALCRYLAFTYYKGRRRLAAAETL
ncbi:MAG: chemotaxis protein CheR, partial [Deltaproteobacteria bacterium]|nr:chemotaxis protein CheR [Deltaproteobacteria bacterium]